MSYSDKVIDHAENPRNVGTLDKSDPTVGTGLVGAPACGDVMRLQIKVNPVTNVIEDAKFKTFGCGSAIAASSLATEWIKGKTIDEAASLQNVTIVEELDLPPVKIHCSVLAEDAIKSAIADYRSKREKLVIFKPLFPEDGDEGFYMELDDYNAMCKAEDEAQKELEERHEEQIRRDKEALKYVRGDDY